MTTDNNKLPLLLEGELILEKGMDISGAKIQIRIVDVTHVDKESVVLIDSVKIQTLGKEQTNIPFVIYGSEPDPLKHYCIEASIFVERTIITKKTYYRTTQSIPVFRDGYPEVIKVHLTKIS